MLKKQKPIAWYIESRYPIMNNHENDNLGRGSIGKLLFSLAIPAITAQIINVLYNVVDRIYIGHIPNVGADALTGIGSTTMQKRFLATAFQRSSSYPSS